MSANAIKVPRDESQTLCTDHVTKPWLISKESPLNLNSRKNAGEGVGKPLNPSRMNE